MSGGRLRAAAPAALRAGGAPAGAAAPLRRRAALPPPLPAAGPRPPGSHARRQGGERGCGGGGRGVGWGVASASTGTRHPPAGCSPACVWAASRQTKSTALHMAAARNHAPCLESLLEAGADASLKDHVSDGANMAEWWGRGEGAGWVCGCGEGPCAGNAPPLRAARSPRPLLPRRAAASTSTPLPSRRRVASRRWTSPRSRTTRIS